MTRGVQTQLTEERWLAEVSAAKDKPTRDELLLRDIWGALGLLGHLVNETEQNDEVDRLERVIAEILQVAERRVLALADAYLAQQRENERLRGVHLSASETPWSFHRGTLRERLEWCRVQHQIAAENPPLHRLSREAKADFDRACVGWYDEMLRQLDEIERAAVSVGSPETSGQ